MTLIPLRTVALTMGEKPAIVAYWSKQLDVSHYKDGSQRWFFSERGSDELRQARYLIRVELYTVAGAKRQLDKLREATRHLYQEDTAVNAGLPIGTVRKAQHAAASGSSAREPT